MRWLLVLILPIPLLTACSDKQPNTALPAVNPEHFLLNASTSAKFLSQQQPMLEPPPQEMGQLRPFHGGTLYRESRRPLDQQALRFPVPIGKPISVLGLSHWPSRGGPCLEIHDREIPHCLSTADKQQKNPQTHLHNACN